MHIIEQLRTWCNGRWDLASNPDCNIENLTIDSRNINKPETSLFIALKTNVRDGHSYVSDAFSKGVRNFLVSEKMDVGLLLGSNIIQVEDTLKALQQIAAYHRKQFDIPVIGITGSNGKTIVKEWLYQIVGSLFNAVRSPKSYNSQIGVPLSVWQIEENNNLGIFEAGISQPGEMERLEKIIQPSIGVFTNIGEAHGEGFIGEAQKINEKLLLFRNVKYLVYCADQSQVDEGILRFIGNLGEKIEDTQLKVFNWSVKRDADMKIKRIVKHKGRTEIEAVFELQHLQITIPFTDDASIENAIHCWCVALLVKIDSLEITHRMANLQPVSMRLELRRGINDCTVINDSYNSDLTSFQLALNYLAQQKQHNKYTVILSDILEIGRQDADLYAEVAAMLNQRSVHRFIGIGTVLYKNKAIFGTNKRRRSTFYKTTDDFLRHFHLLTFENEAILLKGARVFMFEKIGLLLEQRVHQTVMNIELSALKQNLNVFRKELKPGVKTMAMVKAFGYGSGSFEIANLLQDAGVNYLTVAYTDEGVNLRKGGIKMPIMVMSPDISSFDRMIAWKLEPEIYNFKSLDAFTNIADTLKEKGYTIHIKLDTGMHRLGFNKNEIPDLVEKIRGLKSIKIGSIFSHLAASEDPRQDSFTQLQAKLFEELSREIEKSLPYPVLRHLCNSSAIIRHKSLHYNMVRLGIGLYGIDNSDVVQNKLKQISTLKTTIAQTRAIEKGESIGYGHNFIALNNMRIATISIGYADGYPRTMGNGNAFVLVHGKRAFTVGSICMDMCMIDITDITDTGEGDEVIVFGPELPVSLLAKWGNTIPYEIMTGISQRVKRVYMNEG